MSYAIRWTDEAEEQLADVWTNAADRDAVRAAADWIEALLRRDPLNAGESRGGDDRIVIEPPLSVYYRIDHAAGEVWVVSVSRFGPHP